MCTCVWCVCACVMCACACVWCVCACVMCACACVWCVCACVWCVCACVMCACACVWCVCACVWCVCACVVCVCVCSLVEKAVNSETVPVALTCPDLPSVPEDLSLHLRSHSLKLVCNYKHAHSRVSDRACNIYTCTMVCSNRPIRLLNLS